MALGTTVSQLLKEIYPAKVPKATADRILSDKLSKITPNKIVDELTKAGIDKTRRREVLRMLPDRERSQVELMLINTNILAPTRGTPKAKYQLTKLKRKRVKTKKVKSEPMLIGARL